MQFVKGYATVINEYDDETDVETTWQFSDREFKRQLQIVADGGKVDTSKGKVVAQGAYDLDDINNINEAKDLLSYDFATKAQREQRDDERRFARMEFEKPWTEAQYTAFLSRG